MRQSAAHKRQTHERIVEAASRSFRKLGVEGVPIAGLMRELDLTHGGFYRHFDSKEALFAEALAKSLGEVASGLERAGEAGSETGGLKSIIENYLSVEHCLNPAQGCPVAAMASDIGRLPRNVRSSFEGGLKDLMNRIARFMTGATDQDRQLSFLVLFSGLAGALSFARTAADENLRNAILKAASEFYIAAFCDRSVAHADANRRSS